MVSPSSARFRVAAGCLKSRGLGLRLLFLFVCGSGASLCAVGESLTLAWTSAYLDAGLKRTDAALQGALSLPVGERFEFGAFGNVPIHGGEPEDWEAYLVAEIGEWNGLEGSAGVQLGWDPELPAEEGRTTAYELLGGITETRTGIALDFAWDWQGDAVEAVLSWGREWSLVKSWSWRAEAEAGSVIASAEADYRWFAIAAGPQWACCEGVVVRLSGHLGRHDLNTAGAPEKGSVWVVLALDWAR